MVRYNGHATRGAESGKKECTYILHRVQFVKKIQISYFRIFFLLFPTVLKIETHIAYDTTLPPQLKWRGAEVCFNGAKFNLSKVVIM